MKNKVYIIEFWDGKFQRCFSNYNEAVIFQNSRVNWGDYGAKFI